MKPCSKCKIEKDSTQFDKDKRAKSGLSSQCKDCIKEYVLKNKEKIRIRQREWRENNKEKLTKDKKDYYEENKEVISVKSKIYRDATKEQKAEYDKIYR